MKRILSIFIAGSLSLFLLAGVASARYINGWWPSPRTSIDLQVAVYNYYGYQPPVTNIYGNENVYVVDSWSQWNYGDYSSWTSVSQDSETAGDITIKTYQNGNGDDSLGDDNTNQNSISGTSGTENNGNEKGSQNSTSGTENNRNEGGK